jgi:hypothetical protein
MFVKQCFSHPKLYRAWIICLIPVFGPRVARYAGPIVENMQKKRITREESLKLRPYAKGPSMPNVILQPLVYFSYEVKSLTHPRIFELIEHHTVKIL